MTSDDGFLNTAISDLVQPARIFSSQDPISRAAGLLRDSIEHEVIVQDKKDAGVVSARDLLDADNLASRKLVTLMRRVPKVTPGDTLSKAGQIMFENRVRTLPVFENGKLVGLVTASAIANRLANSNHKDETIVRIATPEPICIDVSESAAKARSIMLAKKIDQIPILKEKKLSGVITSDMIALKILPTTDRIIAGERRAGRLDIPAMKLSPARIITNEITDSLKKAVENMISSKSNYSVIVNGDEIHGIVTFRDFMKLLPSPQVSQRPQAEGVNEELPIAIIGLPDDPFQSQYPKERFRSAVKLLSRTWPNLTEARAIIKAGQTKAPKRKYEVQVFLTSENSHYNYRVVNFDLAKAFEEIELWIKKLARREVKNRGPKKRATVRKQTPPSEIS